MTAVVDNRLSAVDLFAGCGGLSLGIKSAGFRVAAAVEISPHAAKTYRRNHRGTPLLEADIRQVSGEHILEATGGLRPDLVVGCAPCQGFCSLTRKWGREDPRNDLLLQMGRLVEQLLPEAVMMENVPGLLKYGARIFRAFIRRLEASGYLPGWRIVQMADHGLPQTRRRLVLLAGRGFMIEFPEPTNGPSSPEGTARMTVKDAISSLGPPIRMSEASRRGGPQRFNWHVVRDLQSQTRARLRAARPGRTWLTVREDLRPECHREGYEGFTNVYGRMRWDQAAPTITTGCTTPAKGRFGHPDRRRTTISVREAATLQGFPEGYRFADDRIDVVCEMIGNAVPPPYAQALGKNLLKAIRDHRKALAAKS